MRRPGNAAFVSSDPPARPSAIEVLALRSWAKGYLASCGQITIADAADELQASAEASGLIAAIGPDAVQEIIAREFGAVR